MPADYDPELIEEFAALIPRQLEARSGKVSYAGRVAFGAPSPIYILGFNPGGHDEDHPDETIGQHTRRVLHEYDDHWSALREEEWVPEGKKSPACQSPRQHSLLHLLDKLERDPGRVPMSNVAFIRSPSAAELGAEDAGTAEATRDFHLHVIERLQVRLVVCIHRTAGEIVTGWLDAHQFIDRWQEQNRRKWSATARRSPSRRVVVAILPDPSRGGWINPAADPSPFVRRLLDQVSSGTAAST